MRYSWVNLVVSARLECQSGYEKLAITYLAFVLFAAALDWLTHRV